MDGLTADDVRTLFERFGERWQRPLVVDLIGASALAFLDSSRSTLDIDYSGSDIQPEGWQIAPGALASEMRMEIEPVPLGEMVPIPEGAGQRSRVIDLHSRCVIPASGHIAMIWGDACRSTG
ncbi:MAG: hypothetical protein ABIV92_09935 [Thermoflexales bacterium]